MEIITAIIIAMGIPSAVMGLGIWTIEKKIEQRDKKNQEDRDRQRRELEKKEDAREKTMLYIIKSVGASIALGEATARAVQRIPDAHCNGDMHAALEYAAKVKHEQKDFLEETAVDKLY
jgi:hypothetical protein